MTIDIYAPGLPVYQRNMKTGEDIFVGSSTASIRDPITQGNSLPVLLHEKLVGRAIRQEKVKLVDEAFVKYQVELFSDIESDKLLPAHDGYFGEIKGVGWTNGIYPRQLVLRTVDGEHLD